MGYHRRAGTAALRARAQMLAKVRAFFAARDVLEVETPALSPAGISDPNIASLKTTANHLQSGGYYLHTSPEYAMKRLLADGIGDIYQICRVFRDDEQGRWHEPEFTLLEWYRIGWDEFALMREVQELLSPILQRKSGLRPVHHVSFSEAFERSVGVSADTADAAALESALRQRELDPGQGLSTEALIDLAVSTLMITGLDPEALSFVYDYPAAQAALAVIKPGPPPAAARFEVFCGGIELANGFRELTDANEQRGRFEDELQTRANRGLPCAPLDEDFLAALSSTPPCAGVAVGVDRLLALALGADNVAATLSFSHGRKD